MQERRAAERLRTNLNARWEGLKIQGRGSVSDLGTLGCFVLTGAEIKSGELIRLEINFPRETISLWGPVVYVVAEMGFAMRFAFGTDDERLHLEKLIKTLN
jgi:PilZ domain-containing protein